MTARQGVDERTSHRAGEPTGERSRTVQRFWPLRPSRRQQLDLALLGALCLLALWALRGSYGGGRFLLVGAIGLGLGLTLAHLATALRWPAVGALAAAGLAFFVLGGAVAVRGQTVAGGLPTAASIRTLGDVSVHGWKDLLTTLPPVGAAGSLLVLPFLLGLAGGTVGGLLSERSASTAAGLVAPVLLLVAAILLGPAQPLTSTWTVWAFTVLALGSAALRSRRRRATIAQGSGRRSRLVTGVAMLVAAGLGAVVLGPHLPGSQAQRRFVLREHVDPPFDVSQYPSPLAGLRKYTRGGARHDSVLMTVSGLPAGTPVKFATLDAYDGSVWAAANVIAADGQTSSFQRIGDTVNTPDAGRRSAIRVNLGPGYDDVWLPSAGELARVRLPAGEAAARTFRYNLVTGTGVVPGGLHPGDSYDLRVLAPPAPQQHPVGFGAPLVSDQFTAFTRSAVNQWADEGTDPWVQVSAVARHLRTAGKYSDGGRDQAQYLPGHGLGRLTAFLAAPQLVGNDEQYAALFALMVNQIGLPARVVLGAVPEADGTVKGADVHAWVEVHLAPGGTDHTGRWLTVPHTDFVPDRSKTPDNAPPQTEKNSAGKVVPPPVSVRPPSTQENPQQPEANVTRHSSTAKKTILGIPVRGRLRAILLWTAPPLLLLMLAAGSIVGAKSWRRRRRRSRGSPVQRLAAGWREVLDHARDLGTTVPAGATRAEQAEALAVAEAPPLAYRADAGVFGPGDPSPEFVVGYWTEVSQTRRAMNAAAGSWRRLRAAVSLRSLRGGRGDDRRHVAGAREARRRAVEEVDCVVR